MHYKKLETPDELTERWQVKKSWLYAQTRYTGPGGIPVIRVGKYLRFDPEAVDRWLREQNDAS
jgi:hypothetical protein